VGTHRLAHRHRNCAADCVAAGFPRHHPIDRITRVGRLRSALTRDSALPTAMPTRRNGSSTSQTNGYSTRANSARGQQRIKRTHQSRNFSIDLPLLTLRNQDKRGSMNVGLYVSTAARSSLKNLVSPALGSSSSNRIGSTSRSRSRRSWISFRSTIKM
jgi:hypothetical protein